MGAHRLQDDRTTDVARGVGRGALATSVALALAGTGAGFATAMPAHDDDGHGAHLEDHGPDGSSVDCASLDDDGVGGLLDGLGLSGSPEAAQDCTTGSDAATSDASSTESGDGHGEYGDAGTASSSSTDGSDPGAQPAAAQAAAPVNPEDVPPAPGETRIVDLPDRPST